MKIIKEGNLDRINYTKKFECERCMCVFECDKGEYRISEGRYDETLFSAKCPTCDNITYNLVKITGMAYG